MKNSLNILLIGVPEIPKFVPRYFDNHQIKFTTFSDNSTFTTTSPQSLSHNDLILYLPSFNPTNNVFLLTARLYGAKPIKLTKEELISKLKIILRNHQRAYLAKKDLYKTQKIKDTTVHYIALGNPSQEPFVFLHGLGSNAISNLTFLKQLARKFFILAPNIPDLFLKHTSYESLARTLYTFIQSTLGDRRYTLAGYSFGGAIATTLTYLFPQAPLKHLVLLNPAGLRTDKTPFDLLYQFLKKQLPPGEPPENFLNTLLTQLTHQPIFSILKLAAEGNPRLKPHSINLPTTILFSTHDELFDLNYKLNFSTLFTCLKTILIKTNHAGILKTRLKQILKILSQLL